MVPFPTMQTKASRGQTMIRFEGDDVWLPVEQIMELFDASQQDVSYHINQIYEEGEQNPERTHKKFLLVRQEGNRSVRRQMSHYFSLRAKW